jgi:hypothetical protein
MKKYRTIATRDFIRTITMGPLQVVTLGSSEATTLDGPRTIELPTRKGTIAVFRTKAHMASFLAAVNAEHPGSVEVLREA